MKHYTFPLSRDEREKRRLKAAQLFKRGRGHAEIARRLNVTPGAVTQWRTAYAHGGLKALKSKGHPGFASKLSENKKERFKRAILKGPLAYGYETNLWTLPRLAAVMKGVAAVTFSEVNIWRIVRKLGFTPQKPTVRAKERDEQAIAGWEAVTLPKLKKMGA
jgi:transposase